MPNLGHNCCNTLLKAIGEMLVRQQMHYVSLRWSSEKSAVPLPDALLFQLDLNPELDTCRPLLLDLVTERHTLLLQLLVVADQARQLSSKLLLIEK